jgi:hypothetical protein
MAYVRKLGKDEELDPEARTATPKGSFGVKAQNLIPAVGLHHVPQPGRGPAESHGGKGRQGQIPRRQRVLPSQALAFGKEGLSDHNHEAVQDAGRERDYRMAHHPIPDRYGIVNRLPSGIMGRHERGRDGKRGGKKGSGRCDASVNGREYNATRTNDSRGE